MSYICNEGAILCHEDEYKNQVSTAFNYPEVISNHFKLHHAVDDHNRRRYSTICLEHVWTTKYFSHCPFSFLLEVIAININLPEAYLMLHHDP